MPELHLHGGAVGLDGAYRQELALSYLKASASATTVNTSALFNSILRPLRTRVSR
jgi:hypothetical protein